MSNSHEQSLDEDVVFEPVTEACPQFLHSESERCALECLLTGGSGAFYMQLNGERLDPFLSPEEVNQLSGWAQDYHSSQVVLEEEADYQGDGEGQEMNDFSAIYFPVHSDAPVPPLELGWPEKECWDCMGQARVYTSPPVEDAPPVREVVRKLLQGAKQVVAIVTDRLSDSAVIGDLHTVASLGVPVYIILNQRSFQENFTPQKLRHPNIRVRILGGKSFCSRDGKMVVGELKDNFVLVDLEKVMVGSYSLTWTDAHLHRQLVMVMSGPVVESFDREFRILYAASLPVPNTCRAGLSMVRDEGPVRLHRPKNLDLSYGKPFLSDSILSPPPSYTGKPIDWEALGLIQKGHDIPGIPPPWVIEGPVQYCGPSLEEPLVIEEKPIPKQYVPRSIEEKPIPKQYVPRSIEEKPIPKQYVPRSSEEKPIPKQYVPRSIEEKPIPKQYVPRSSEEKPIPKQYVTRSSEEKPIPKQYVPRSIEEKPIPKQYVPRSNVQPLEESRIGTNPASGIDNHMSFRALRRLSRQSDEDRQCVDKLSEHERVRSPRAGPTPQSPSSRREPTLRRGSIFDEVNPEVPKPETKTGKTKKPLILRVPQWDNFSSLSDIMKKIKGQQSSSAPKRGPKPAASEISRSMMDLSTGYTDTHLRQTSCYEGLPQTPALALMKNRTDDKNRPPKTFLSPYRPRSSTFNFQKEWRSPTRQSHDEEN